MAREASLADIQHAVTHSGMEVEIFVHGALCVSHSGQCLFSSLVGGRSGNRGLCAQPCRLPYAAQTCKNRPKNEYPLSLKDLSLARHIPSLIEAGVASLKIEGRMKSPAYVGGVVSVFRKLLDERRFATDEEMQHLSALFSRDGFTDGYFCQSISPDMLGMRDDEAKSLTTKTEKQVRTDKPVGHLPLHISVTAKASAPLTLTLSSQLYRQGEEGNTPVSVTVCGDIPETALNRPTDGDTLQKQLTRLGGTEYTPTAMTMDLDDGIMIPVSKLNSLRREAVEALDRARDTAFASLWASRNKSVARSLPPPTPPGTVGTIPRNTARFRRPEQIPAETERFFDLIYLPLDTWQSATEGQAERGVILPPVVFDREIPRVKAALAECLSNGARHFLLSNIGHIPLVREVLRDTPDIAADTVTLHGDFRFNIGNRLTAELLLEDLEDLLLSPELTEPKLRDLCRFSPRAAGAVVYGRMPLMLLEKCLITSLYPTGRIKKDQPLPFGKCGEACAVCRKDQAAMVDRRGMTFPVLREYPHRNLVVNSLPLCMTDKEDVLDRLGVIQRHYIFTTESPSDVCRILQAAKEHKPLGRDVRRIPK